MPPQTEQVHGNSAGNLVHRAFIAAQGEWIYHSINTSPDTGIYRTRTDGISLMKISDDAGSYLNIVGDWIFYINGMDSMLYKVGTAGGTRTKLSGHVVGQAIVVSDWVYFTEYRDGHWNISKMRTDASERTELIRDTAWSINVSGEWIYYSNAGDGGKIYKMKTDGSERTRVNNEASHHIQVVDGWIYYIQMPLGGGLEKGIICKVRTDGGGRTRIGSESGVNLHVHGEWLFYFNPSASKKGFYRAALDGSSPVMISGMPAGEYWIIREYVYYRNIADEGKPYQLMLDGSVNRPLR